MDSYKYEKCWGCLTKQQPNSLAHMELGGCMYESESTCDGCINNSGNELDHMELGGCISERFHISKETNISSSYQNIFIRGIEYLYEIKSNKLFIRDNLNQPICRYDLKTHKLLPL